MERGYSPGVQEDVGHGCVRQVKRRDHPNDHRLVGCRWVFKVKRNGVYCARLVANGVSQITGVDFVEKLRFTPFASGFSWYLVLKIACLHVSFTTYENFYKLSKMHCLLIWFSTFQPSEVSETEIQQSNIYPLIH